MTLRPVPQVLGKTLVVLSVLLFSLSTAGPAFAQGGTIRDEAPRAEAEGGAGGGAPNPVASAWMLVDAESGERLAGENVAEELPMASTTKIMTALVVLGSGVDPDERVTVSAEAASYARPLYSNIGLREGDVLTMRELLKAAMIESANDAAYALAGHVGGSTDGFVQTMNRRAEELGLEDTSFENPVGFDGPDHHSSARDLAKLAQEALSRPELRTILDTPSTTIDTAGAGATQAREITLQSTNELLYSYPATTGVKTGTTPAAGESLVASASRDGESYIAVLLNAADRFGSAENELEYGFSAYDRLGVIEEGEGYATEPLPHRPDEEVELVAGEGVQRLLPAGVGVEHRVEVPEELPGSAERGERIGRVVAESDGERVARAPLVAAEGYDEASAWQRLWYTAGSIFGEQE